MKFWPLVLLMVIIASCATHVEKESADELDGNWQVLSFTASGERGTAKEARQYQVVFDAGTFYVTKDGVEIQHGTYKLISGGSPEAVNFTFATGDNLKGKSALGIYKVTKGELTICFTAPAENPAPDEERPQVFESTAENGYRLNVYGRITE